jgi:hypothetical protein
MILIIIGKDNAVSRFPQIRVDSPEKKIGDISFLKKSSRLFQKTAFGEG